MTAFVMTHLPPSRVPGGGLINDKLLHCVGYLALGVVTMLTLAFLRGRRPVGGMIPGVWIAMLGYALLDESTQPLAGRTFEWGDLAADGTGALLGIVVVVLLSRQRR